MRRMRKCKGVSAGLAGFAALLILGAPIAGGAGDAQQIAVCGPSDGQTISDSVADAANTGEAYIIGAGDKLAIQVFQVKDLSMESITVDATGALQLPLIGRVVAAGRTTAQLQDDIAQRLGDRYLQSPQVSVTVIDSASQKITVEGEVRTPGVFAMKGRTTLMEAIAMAGGPAGDADLHKVAVIRSDHGLRRAAVCDYESIRLGRQVDPALHGDDIVVVDGSRAKMIWAAAVKTLPLFTIFAYLR